MTFEKSVLWKGLGENDDGTAKKLADEFEKIRENAAALTSHIAGDVPFFTEHGIGHLDALWGVADQIIDRQFTLNPVETFVLGCAFLIHDAGMTVAAYPGGMKGIKATAAWKRLEAQAKTQKFKNAKERTDKVLADFLRLQHPNHANDLPHVSWKDGDGNDRFLIDDPDIRSDLGQYIGAVARSHWDWHESLEQEFAECKMPPTGYGDCEIDLLKLACVLRCTDAANIDASRAKGFLWALRRNQLSKESNDHWTFQNRMSQGRCIDQEIVFTSTKKFERKTASAWWLAHDTLKMVDHELRACNAILKRRRALELGPKGVKYIDSPSSLKALIEVDGWEPVDTAFTVADLPRLVERLGGAALYGDDAMAPVREVIQNGMDAVRIRRKADPEHEGAVKITVPKIKTGAKLVFEDDGIGMSADGLVRNLLSFGGSNWLTDPALSELEEDYPTEEAVAGRFGIGFFSIFMLADHVRVISNRWDAGNAETMVLEFDRGLESRPMMYKAAKAEQRSCGTRIEAVLRGDRLPFQVQGLHKQFNEQSELGELFPASDVLLNVDARRKQSEVDGRHWATEPGVELLARICPDASKEELESAAQQLVLISDRKGRVLGRAALAKNRLTFRSYPGAIVQRGAGLARSDRFVGIIPGSPARAARDGAILQIDEVDLRKWVVGQLDTWGESDEYDLSLLHVFARSLDLIEDAPIYRLNGKLVSETELREIFQIDSCFFVRFPDEELSREGSLPLSDIFWGTITDMPDLGAPSAKLWKIKTLRLETVLCDAMEIAPEVVTGMVAGWNSKVVRKIGENKLGEEIKSRAYVLRRGMTLEEFKKENEIED